MTSTQVMKALYIEGSSMGNCILGVHIEFRLSAVIPCKGSSMQQRACQCKQKYSLSNGVTFKVICSPPRATGGR